MLTEYLVKKIITSCMRNHAEYFISEAPKSIRGKFVEFGGEVAHIRGFLGGKSKEEAPQ